MKDNGMTLLRQGQRDGAANAARRSSDQRRARGVCCWMIHGSLQLVIERLLTIPHAQMKTAMHFPCMRRGRPIRMVNAAESITRNRSLGITLRQG
jgi:hypothetical protein